LNRNTQQLARLVPALLRAARGRPWLLAVAVIGVVACGLLAPPLDPPRAAPPAGGRPAATRTAQADSPAGIAELAGLSPASGREVFVSDAGLRYTRGSTHGHRLMHVIAHTRDEPDRPGQHGVFDAKGPAEVFALIDEAYQQALAGERTATEREGPRTVYTVDLGRRVGTIGGQSGARRGRPVARQVRLVVQGDRLITAFPVVPQ